MKHFLTAALLILIGCTSRPDALSKAPMPGIMGTPSYSTDDNSTTERVSFRTATSEAEVRRAFASYCEQRRMKPDSRQQSGPIQWWKSERDFLGILVSPDEAGHLLYVTYFYNE